MNHSVRRWAVLGLSLVLAAGCHKKETAATDVSHEAESKLPPQEQVAGTDKTSAVADPSVPATVATSAEVSPAEKEGYEAWFKKYHLDLTDPNMLNADSDGDGFTN